MNEPGKAAPAIGFVFAFASGIATLLLVAYASSGAPSSAGGIAFDSWVASPFLVLCGLNLHCMRASAPHALRLAAAITSCAASLSVFLYADAVFSPRAGLIFLFLPAWILAGTAAILLLSFLLVLWRTGR
jgi:hypothetical protein